MFSIGESVQEAIELTNHGFFERAYMPAANAIVGTVAKVTGGDGQSELAIQRFVKDNFLLISFMGMPRSASIAVEYSF